MNVKSLSQEGPLCFGVQEPSGKKANVTCFECQQRDHYAAECPLRTTVAATEATEQSASQVNTVSPGLLAFTRIQVQGSSDCGSPD